MLTIGGLVLLVYLARRPINWVGMHVFAFSVGFAVGWEFFKRR